MKRCLSRWNATTVLHLEHDAWDIWKQWQGWLDKAILIAGVISTCNRYQAGVKPFLQFPEAKGWLLTFAANNLDVLYIKVWGYFYETLLPNLPCGMSTGCDMYGDWIGTSDRWGPPYIWRASPVWIGFSEDGVSDSTVCHYLSFLKYKHNVHWKASLVDGCKQEDMLARRLAHKSHPTCQINH